VAPVRADEAWLYRLRGARHRTINFGHVQTTTDTALGQSRLEFRLWDSTVQPGRVQAQIKTSLAMAAFALDHDTPAEAPSAERALGNASEQYRDRRVTQADLDHPDPEDSGWVHRTAPVRQMIDQLFRRDIDKQQILAAWASGTLDRIEQ